MRKALVSLVCAALGVVVAAACNSVGDCPSSSITPGGSCSSENLQCAYVLPASDDAGTPTSCTCMAGVWNCPSAGSGDDAASDDSTLVEATAEGAAEASAEAAETSNDASNQEAGTDGPAESSSDAGGG
jgi:hypothetical protein